MKKPINFPPTNLSAVQVDIKLWPEQAKVIRSPKRFKGVFAGKRGGKTEVGAVQSGLWQQRKLNFVNNNRDPFLGIIAAPTHAMLKELSWKKFMGYFGHLVKRTWENPKRALWHDGSEILGISADNPARAEGLKANWVWCDEIFQMKRQFFLEMMARLSDSLGYGIFTGSLGVQYVNPKMHWAHKEFKVNPDLETECFEWATAKNPYFSRKELERLRGKLDEQTFRAMFELCWDIMAGNAVYGEWRADKNERKLKYNPNLPLYVSIDWGYAHPAAVLFIQYNEITDEVFVIDEIVESRLLVHTLYDKIIKRAEQKGYKLNPKNFCADIAGNQEREQTGISNIEYFDSQIIDGQNVDVSCVRRGVLYGISIVRPYVNSMSGIRRLFIDEDNCPLLLDSLKNYRYPEREGIILNENPVKEADDPCDSLRYFFVNFLERDWLPEIEVSQLGTG
jgi:hypothetical protein